MVKPSYRTDSPCVYHKRYQQALEDFAIPHLLTHLIWLDKLSPSSPWTVADTAWEDDLEPLEEAA